MAYNTSPLYPTRFVAAISVVLFHFSPPSIWMSCFDLLKNNNEAVNYFFFISGFVMIISNKAFLYDTDKDSSFSSKDFWVKRIARIYPIYVFSLLAVVFFHFCIKHIDTNTVIIRLPFELVGIQRWLYKGSINFPGWSISCEFLFYLSFPILIVYLKKNIKRYQWVVLIFFAVSVIINATLFYLKDKTSIHSYGGRLIDILYLHPIFKFSIFMFGTLCGTTYIKNSLKFFNNYRNRVLTIMACVIIIFLTLYYSPKDFFILNTGLLCFVYFFLVIAICSFNYEETKVFNSKLSILSGEISYGIYILQYPFSVFYKYYFADVKNGLQLGLFVVCLIICSCLTYFFIEQPFKKLILNEFYKRKSVKVNAVNSI